MAVRHYEAGDGLFFDLRRDGSVKMEIRALDQDSAPVIFEALWDRRLWDRIVVAMSMVKLKEQL